MLGTLTLTFTFGVLTTGVVIVGALMPLVPTPVTLMPVVPIPVALMPVVLILVVLMPVVLTPLVETFEPPPCFKAPVARTRYFPGPLPYLPGLWPR